jgi:RNA polymerase sigma-70 factor (ECF subfamily)
VGEHVSAAQNEARSPVVDDLLVRVARGDRSAFATLYDLLADVVFRRCLVIVRDFAHAEDALQDTMLELWRTASRFDPTLGGARSWVLTIAHHRAVDKVRRNQSTADRDRADATRQTPRPFDEVTDEVVLRAERAQVRDLVVAELTDRQRSVIELVYYRGHTMAEAAVLLNTPLGTVKARVRDALIRLRSAVFASLDEVPGP